MRPGDAVDAVRNLLGVFVEEEERFRRIDAAVAPPSDYALRSIYGISHDSRNFDRHMKIARQAFNPSLALMLDTYSQSLKVDNYFRSDSDDDGGVGGDYPGSVLARGREPAEPWKWWQRNRMDGRQTGLHHAACKYGVSYASVLPADMVQRPGLGGVDSGRGAVIDVFNPKRLTTVYGESWDWAEYPMLALQHVDRGFRLFDERYVYFFGVDRKPESASEWLKSYYCSGDNLRYIERREHGVGAVPVVRYRDRMMTDGEESFGMVEPLIGIADRINATNYQEGVARHFAAFKQRYVIGWAPKDEGEAFRQKASDTWWFKDDKSKVDVGQFDETNLGQYVISRQSMDQTFAAVAQLPATVMGASAITNVSAEGLAALERSKDSKNSELQVSLGESHEQLFRLAAFISGDSASAEDFGAEVKWKDTSAKSLAQTVDALGKIATMLGVPAEVLWAEIPGWTQQQVQRALEAKDRLLEQLSDPVDSFLAGDLAGVADPAGEPGEGTGGSYYKSNNGGSGKVRLSGPLKAGIYQPSLIDRDGDGILGE